MTFKKLLLFAFVLSLSLSKAQTQITKETSAGFDEQKAIKEAINKGVPKQFMDEYINGERVRFMTRNHKHVVGENNSKEQEYKKQVTLINMNTGKMYQTIQTSQCGNSDLSLQNYTNWTGEASDVNAQGIVYPVNTYTPGLGMNENGGVPIYINRDPCQGANYTTDRHVIMTTPIGVAQNTLANAFPTGYDPTCQNPITGLYDLSMTPSNGVNCIRLGSCYIQYTGQKLSYQINVNSSNALFTYQYAVVINDGTHGIGQQPAFTFAMKDGSGNVLTNGGNPGCVQYNVDATNATTDTSYIKSTSSCGSSGVPFTYYRKWRTVTVDLSFYIGSTVYADFETMDCIYSGHFCYAYISATCGALNASISGFCGGSGNATMTAPGGFASYQWYGPPGGTILIPGATNAVYTATGATAGQVYSVDCITLQGCTTKLNVTVTASNIYATLGASPSCRGGANGSTSVAVTGGTAFSYTWTNSGGTVVSNTTTATGIPPGTYSIHIVDNTGNCPNKDSTIIVGTIPPVLTSTVAQLCGNQVAPALVAPTIGPYSWTFNGSTTVLATTQVYSPSFTIAPTEFFVVTYSDPTTGCLDSLKTTFNQVNINFAPLPSPPCNGGTNGNINLTPTGGTNFPEYTWTVNGNDPRTFYGNNSDSANTHLPPLLVDSLGMGTYTVVITPFGNPSCAYTYTVTLTPGSIPPPTVEALKGCALTNLSIPSVLIGGSTHDWYSGGTSLGNSYPYVTTGVTAGAIYTDTIRNAAGCKTVYKATLTVESFNASITSPEGIHCHNDSTGKIKTTATTEVNGPLGTPYTFTWMYPAPYTSPAVVNAGTGTPQSSTESGLHAGTYTVVIQSGNCIATKTYTLINPPALDTDTIFGYFCPKDSLALLIVEELGHPKYTWILNGVVVPGVINDSLWVLTSQVNNYVVAYLSGNCKDTAKTLVVFPSYHALRPDTTVNIFTPNDDKINDYFFPFYSKGFTQYEVDKQLEIYEIFIYNRWGKLVFTSDHYTNPWTGKDQSGVPQDDGTFYYILKYKSNCATKADIVEKKGFVQLLR